MYVVCICLSACVGDMLWGKYTCLSAYVGDIASVSACILHLHRTHILHTYTYMPCVYIPATYMLCINSVAGAVVC